MADHRSSVEEYPREPQGAFQEAELLHSDRLLWMQESRRHVSSWSDRINARPCKAP